MAYSSFILDTSSLLDLYFSSIFFQYTAFYYVFIMLSFENKHFEFWWDPIYLLILWMSFLKKSLPNPKSQTFSSMSSITVLGLTCKLLWLKFYLWHETSIEVNLLSCRSPTVEKIVLFSLHCFVTFVEKLVFLTIKVGFLRVYC